MEKDTIRVNVMKQEVTFGVRDPHDLDVDRVVAALKKEGFDSVQVLSQPKG